MLYEGADSGRASGVLEGYVSWQHPYRNTQIYVHPQVVRSLSVHALDSAKQRTEIGGVLWGKAGPDDSLIITDATLVQSSGPFFNATPTDGRNLQQALTGRAPKATLSLAGYFRSTIREGLSLTPQDQTLIRQYVHDPDAVFLVIKPANSGVCTAGLTFWEDGRLQTDASYAEIPFIAFDEPASSIAASLRETSAPRREERDRPIAEQWAGGYGVGPASQEEPSIVAILRESALRNRPPQNSAPALDNHSKPIGPDEAAKRRTLALLLLAFASICLIVIMAAAGAYFGFPLLRARLHPAPEPRPKLGLDLQAARTADGQLNLNWDRNASEVVNAPGALLTITDGRHVSKLKLDNAQLRSGKLMYFPRNGDVQFRLELNTDTLHTVAESVRVLSSAAELSQARRARNGERSKPEAQGSFPSQWTVSAEVQSSRADADGNSSAMQETGNPNPPPLPLPPLSVPPLVTATTSAVRSESFLSSIYVPPRVVEEMMPETTPLGRFARISVQVSIDQTGHVTAAYAVKEEGSENRELATIATAAAQRWRFQPATLNGKPVPAEYRIVFAFHREIPE